MKHFYQAMTARRAITLGLRPSRSYGYVVRIAPPIEYTKEGDDIEGIGWVPYWGGPRKVTQHFHGWYRYKDDAVRRAEEMNR